MRPHLLDNWDPQNDGAGFVLARANRAFQALELLEATYPDDPIGNLERLIAADKERGND